VCFVCSCGFCVHCTQLVILNTRVCVGRLADIPEQATRGGWVFQPGTDPVTGARDLW
jgi:hypothetical protein